MADCLQAVIDADGGSTWRANAIYEMRGHALRSVAAIRSRLRCKNELWPLDPCKKAPRLPFEVDRVAVGLARRDDPAYSV